MLLIVLWCRGLGGEGRVADGREVRVVGRGCRCVGSLSHLMFLWPRALLCAIWGGRLVAFRCRKVCGGLGLRCVRARLILVILWRDGEVG